MKKIFPYLVHFIYNLLYKIKKICFKNYSFRSHYLLNCFTVYVMNLKLLKIKTSQNIKIYLDSNDSLGLSFNKDYELNETNYIIDNVRDDMHVLDIGANIGYYTTLLCKKAKNGMVYAFEPNTDNFNLLKRNLSLNNFNNFKLFRVACGDDICRKELYLSENNKGDHRLYNLKNENRYFETVDVVKIDSLLSDIKRLDFVKIDIQGYELSALKGTSSLLKKFKPIIISEFWPEGLKLNHVSPIEYINFFLELDYEFFNIDSYYLNSRVTKINKNQLKSLLKTTENDKNILLVNKNAKY